MHEYSGEHRPCKKQSRFIGLSKVGGNQAYRRKQCGDAAPIARIAATAPKIEDWTEWLTA